MIWKAIQANFIQKNIKMNIFVLIWLWTQRALASCHKNHYSKYKSSDLIGWLCETKSWHICYDEVLGRRTKPICFDQNDNKQNEQKSGMFVFIPLYVKYLDFILTLIHILHASMSMFDYITSTVETRACPWRDCWMKKMTKICQVRWFFVGKWKKSIKIGQVLAKFDQLWSTLIDLKSDPEWSKNHENEI